MDNAVNMILSVCFDGDGKLHLLETVGHHGLIVVEADDVGILFSENLSDIEQLSRFIRKLYGEAEYASA